MVVAQLVERSLPKPEVRGSNPVIGKNLFIYWTILYCQLCIEKMKIKKKEAGIGPFFKMFIGPVQADASEWALKLTICVLRNPTASAIAYENRFDLKDDQ